MCVGNKSSERAEAKEVGATGEASEGSGEDKKRADVISSVGVVSEGDNGGGVKKRQRSKLILNQTRQGGRRLRDLPTRVTNNSSCIDRRENWGRKRRNVKPMDHRRCRLRMKV